MQIERRAGAERRNINLPSITFRRQQERRWNGSGQSLRVVNGEESYETFDPYWEPVKGQDDD